MFFKSHLNIAFCIPEISVNRLVLYFKHTLTSGIVKVGINTEYDGYCESAQMNIIGERFIRAKNRQETK